LALPSTHLQTEAVGEKFPSLRLKLLLLAALLLACCAGGGVAQTADDDDEDDAQSWSELELSLPLNKAVALSLFGELRLERNLRDVGNTRAGAAVSFDLGRHFTLKPIYLYVPDYSPRGRTNYSHRLRLDGTIKFPLRKFTVSDRSRVEWRLRRSREDSARYRNRLSVEFPLTVRGAELKPFVADEVFYDFGDGAWMRNRFSVGVGKNLSDRVTGETYYTLQNERDSRPGVIHVIGTGLKLTLR